MSRRVRVKPSRAQSIMGFFVGIIFCFIGLFVVVPSVGPFGILWTLMAVIITCMNGYNAFSNKGIATSEIIIDDDNNNTNYYQNNNNYNNRNSTSYNNNYNNFTDNQQKDLNAEKSAEERLSEIQSLYNKGLITTEEYQASREKILEDL